MITIYCDRGRLRLMNFFQPKGSFKMADSISRRDIIGSAAAVAVGMMAGVVSADDIRPLADVKKTGWWIKICPHKTECNSISFRIGPDKENINEEFTWSKGQPTEFDLKKNANTAKLYCYAKVNPHKKNGYFGLCYGEQVCSKHWDFDDDEDHDVKQSDKDEWKCN